MSRTNYITRLVLLISLTLAITLAGLPQPVTGPLVNTMLLLTTMLLDMTGGIILGLITPGTAAIRGQLPPILAPMVPFIMLGNVIIVVVFAVIVKSLKSTRLHKDQPLISPAHWIALVPASVAKTLWLYYSVKLILPMVFGKQLPEAFIAMMAIPQLVTALIGGALAFFLAGILVKVLK